MARYLKFATSNPYDKHLVSDKSSKSGLKLLGNSQIEDVI